VAQAKDTRVITINAKVNASAFTADEAAFLNEYLNHYNHIKFITASKIKKKSLTGLSISQIKSLCDRNDILPYRIFNAGLYQQIHGQIKSQLSNKENYLDNVRDKIKSVEKKLQKQLNTVILINSMTPVQRNYAANRKRLAKAVVNSATYRNQLLRLRSREQRLSHEIANGDFKICYGSAGLLSKRNRIHVNDKEKLSSWRKQWNALRYGQMLFVGSTDELLGNSNANIALDENNQFILNITVPVSMKKQYGFSKVSVPVKVSYYTEELKNHIDFHLYCKKACKHTKAEKEAAKARGKALKVPTSSLSIRLMRNAKGDYDIGIGLNTSLERRPELKTVEGYGLIGVDINPDHLDVAETDAKGNYLRGWSVPVDLKDKSTKQRKTILSQATKSIVDYALSVGKSVVIEDLDFTKKKKALKDNYNKHYARMLSAFAYGKIREYFTGQCWRLGVGLLAVNPAYTSFIGNVKYRSKITPEANKHTPAAYVIARRCQGFGEKFPESVVRLRKVKKENVDVLMAEQVLLREIGADGGKARFSNLKRLQKKAYGNGRDLEISSMRLQKMPGLNGIPLCHELFVSNRYAFGCGSLK